MSALCLSDIVILNDELFEGFLGRFLSWLSELYRAVFRIYHDATANKEQTSRLTLAASMHFETQSLASVSR